MKFTCGAHRSRIISVDSLYSSIVKPHVRALVMHKALVLESFEAGFELRALPTPIAVHGSAVVQVLVTPVISYLREIYNGKRQYSIPMPLVGGLSAIGRISSVGPDATKLTTGQLVFVDCVIRARDNPSTVFLTAINDGGTPGSKKLMQDVWRDGTLAEYVHIPLENCIPLQEEVLCHRLGYSMEDLMYIGLLLVPYGGMRDITLEPGETIVISPATGSYGGGAVLVAAVMGAKVIAMGRNEQELARLKQHIVRVVPGANIETVKITGDEAVDTASLKPHEPIDAVFDISPPEAAKSTHLKSAMSGLRHKGRVSLMGFADFSASAWEVIGKDLCFRGKLMYSREDMLNFVKLLEAGRFPRGRDFAETKSYKLYGWREAFDEAAVFTGCGRSVVITP